MLPDSDARPFRERIASTGAGTRRRAIAVLALGLAIVAGATVSQVGGRGAHLYTPERLDRAAVGGETFLAQPGRRFVSARAGDRGPAGVAAAYGYPVRCLSVTILPTDRAYARADFNHLSPCGRYTGDPTAIFRYSSGAWRPVLDAVGVLCPVRSLPAEVQTRLDVCVAPNSRAGPSRTR